MENLPAPLAIAICKELPDIKSLDAIVQASPCFADIFSNHAAEILEHLMERTLHDHIRLLLRGYAILQWRPETFVQMQGQRDPEAALRALSKDARNPLTKKVPPEAIMQSVRLFTRVHAVASTILDAKLNYLRSFPFEHIKDPWLQENWMMTCGYDAEGRVVNPWPDAYTCQVILTPPSWIEEQRVMRALLRVALLSTLAVLVAPRILDDSQPASSEKGAVDVKEGHFGKVSPWAQSSTLRSFREILFPDDHESTEPHVPRYTYEHDEFEEVLATFARTNISLDPSEPSKELANHWRAPAQVDPLAWQMDFPERALWAQTPEYLDKPHPAWVTARGLFNSSLRSPLTGADWLVLRGLGMGLWDGRRLVEQLEMYPLTMDRMSRMGDHKFTWKKLYDEEVLRQCAEIMNKTDPRIRNAPTD